MKEWIRCKNDKRSANTSGLRTPCFEASVALFCAHTRKHAVRRNVYSIDVDSERLRNVWVTGTTDWPDTPMPSEHCCHVGVVDVAENAVCLFVLIAQPRIRLCVKGR